MARKKQQQQQEQVTFGGTKKSVVNQYNAGSDDRG